MAERAMHLVQPATPADVLAQAIARLEAIQAELGRVYLTADDVLLVRAAVDADEHGDFMDGVGIMAKGDPYWDRDIALALERLAAAIDPLLVWLRSEAGKMRLEQNQPGIPIHYADAIAVANALVDGPV